MPGIGDPQRIGRVETDQSGGSARRDGVRTRRVLAVLALAVLGAIFIAIASSGPPESPQLAPLAPPADDGLTAPTTTSRAAVPATTVQRTPRTTIRPRPADSLTVSVDAGRLDGIAVLAPRPSGTPTPQDLWVIDDGDPISLQAPLWPGDFSHPLVLESGKVLLADLSTAYSVDAETGETTDLAEASFVLPSGLDGRAWLVGTGASWVAPVDVSTGSIGPRIDGETLGGWPIAGAADGLIVTRFDESEGRFEYWRPGLPPVRLDLRDDAQTGILTAADTTAVALSPGPLVDVIDLVTQETTATFEVEVGEDLIVDGCLSPGGFFVALVSSGGIAQVLDTRDGTVMQTLHGIQQIWGVAWTTDAQLLVVGENREGGRQVLEAVDVFTGRVDEIAELAPSRSWWLTASGSDC